MKRFILNVLFFFAIVACVDVLIGGLGDYLQAHAKGGASKRINDLVVKDTHDVVILGSSRAHHHYDTPFLSDTLGLDVYNAGYDGNGVILAYGLLELILDRYTPQLVIFDVEESFDINVYENDNGYKRYVSFLKPYYRQPAIASLIRDISEEEWYKVHSGLIRYNSALLSMAKDYLFGHAVSNKGYEPSIGVYTGEPNKGDKKEVVVDYFKLGYIEKLIELAKNRGVQIVFVASPKYGNTSSESLQSVMTICRQRGVPFFDYFADEEFMTHKEWFKEPMHLNGEGARIFSRRLITDLFETVL